MDFITLCLTSILSYLSLFKSNGKLAILPTTSRRPATPEDLQLKPEQESLFAEIIMDGKIIEKNLSNMGFDLNWLAKQMSLHGIRSAVDVFLAVCDKNQNISFYLKENYKKH